jgi:hypothetical protein
MQEIDAVKFLRILEMKRKSPEPPKSGSGQE